MFMVSEDESTPGPGVDVVELQTGSVRPLLITRNSKRQNGPSKLISE
jgi:hypothetical protein